MFYGLPFAFSTTVVSSFFPFTLQNLITVDVISSITWMFVWQWQPQEDRQKKRDKGSRLTNRPFLLQKRNNLNILLSPTTITSCHPFVLESSDLKLSMIQKQLVCVCKS